MRKALLLEILYVVLILLALFGIAFFQLLFILPGKIDTESIVFSLSLITVVVILLIYVRKLRKQLQQSTHEQSQRINPNHPKTEDVHAVKKQDVVTKDVHIRGINKKVKIATAVMLLSLLGLGMAYLIDSKIQDAYLQKIGEYSHYEQENKITQIAS